MGSDGKVTDLLAALEASVNAARDARRDRERCHACGRTPAAGFASVNGARYCHGDNDPTPTCYSRNTWRAGSTPGGSDE